MDNVLTAKSAISSPSDVKEVATFKRLATRTETEQTGKTVTVYVDDQPVEMHPNDTAAAAVLTSGLRYGRTTTVGNSARAPYCMMGVCFECLLEIDGLENVQGCMTQVQEGMRIKRQNQARELSAG